MSRPCAIQSCKRISRTLCYECNQNFCREHMREHDLSLNAQSNSFSDEISALSNRLKSIDLQNVTNQSREKLERWRDESHKTIDRFFDQKCRELDRFVARKKSEQRDEIDRLRTKLAEFGQEQEATEKNIDLLSKTVRDLEKEMKRIEQSSFRLEARSLVLDDSLIQIDDTDACRFDVSALLTTCKSISYPRDNWEPLACSNHHLLIHQEPNLCLVDRDLTIIKQNTWIYGTIYDMCWSSALNGFVVINGSDVFLVDEETMTIETIQMPQKSKWLSCTASDTSLFLSTKVWGSSIMEFNLSPTVELVKHWQSPDTCTRDEVINGIVYNNGMICMMIKNPTEKTIHIEMRSSTTLDRLWSLRLNIAYSQTIRTRCCLITHNEWLVVDRNTSRIFHISKDGKVKSSAAYNPAPFCATVFDDDMLAVSTARGVNLHKL